MWTRRVVLKVWPLNQQHRELFKQCAFPELPLACGVRSCGGGEQPAEFEQAPENKLPVCTVPLAHGRKERSLSSSVRCPSELAESGTRAQAFRAQGLGRFP